MKLTSEGSEELQVMDGATLVKLKSSMIDALYSWVLVDISQEQFFVIGKECKETLSILFEELANERDNYSTASSCIGELLILCKKFEDKELGNFLSQNLLLLEPKCKRICEEENIEAVETYATMFTDLGDCQLMNILNGDPQIIRIILMFFKIEGKHFKA